MSKKSYQTLLFVPNIICYIRLLLLIISVLCALHYPIITFACYFFNAVFDGLDGYAARKLKQESLFGRMFDYVIDRATIAALFVVLAILYSRWWYVFYGFLALELAGHFCQLYMTIFTGEKSHKQVDFNHYALLNSYYNNRLFMVFCCASHDLWLGMIYWYHFYPHNYLIWPILIFLPGFLTKAWIHLLKIIYASRVSLSAAEKKYEY